MVMGCQGWLSKVLPVGPHMTESRRGNCAMWRKRAEPVVDFGERRATRGVAGFGALVRSGESGSRASHPVVVRGLDQRADRRGVRRAHGQRAALAVDFWPQGGRGVARPQ